MKIQSKDRRVLYIAPVLRYLYSACESMFGEIEEIVIKMET